jgi:hypothetical protein
MFKVQASFAALALLGVAAAVGAPAAAQEQEQTTGDRIAEIIVYGSDPCPRSTDDEVVVCARKPEAERYRIPERLRTGGARQSREAWAARARSFETATANGIRSCTPVGPAGQAGCMQQIIDQALAERGEEEAANTPPEE